MGLIFDADSIRVTSIRPEVAHGGQRVTLPARLDQARLRQVDVGIGDDVFPETEWLDYPSLPDLPRPCLRAQWAGFVGRNCLAGAPAALASVVVGIARFVGPVLAAPGHGRAFGGSWPPGGPWRSTDGSAA